MIVYNTQIFGTINSCNWDSYSYTALLKFNLPLLVDNEIDFSRNNQDVLKLPHMLRVCVLVNDQDFRVCYLVGLMFKISQVLSILMRSVHTRLVTLSRQGLPLTRGA